MRDFSPAAWLLIAQGTASVEWSRWVRQAVQHPTEQVKSCCARGASDHIRGGGRYNLGVSSQHSTMYPEICHTVCIVQFECRRVFSSLLILGLFALLWLAVIS